MADILKFDLAKKRLPPPNTDARIEYMYAPDIDPTHPYAIRAICENLNAGVWLTREDFIGLITDLVDMLKEEQIG